MMEIKYQNKMKINTAVSDVFLDLLTIVLILMMFVPQFQSLSIYNILFIFFELFWAILALIVRPSFFLGRIKYIHYSFLLCLITIVFPLLFSANIVANRYSSFISIPIFYSIYFYNALYRGVAANLRLAIFAIIPITYTSIQTILVLFENPFAARSIKTFDEHSVGLWLKGVSGYHLIYSSVIILLLLIPVIYNTKQFKIKFAFLSFSLLLTVLIVLSSYFTALIIVFFGIFLYITLHFTKRNVFIFLLPIFLVCAIFPGHVKNIVIESILFITPEGGRVTRVLEVMKNADINDIDLIEVDSRSDVREKSLNTFMQFPLGGYITSLNGGNFSIDEIGQHSYLLDTYAFFGVFIGTYAFWVMSRPFAMRIKSKYGHKLKVFSFIILLAYLIIIIGNNLTSSIGFAAFFLYPTIFDYLSETAQNS